MKVRIRDIQRVAHRIATERGWHDDDETPPAPVRLVAWMGLVCSEAAEAMESVREGKMITTYRSDGKPLGFPIELADIIIRVLDTAEVLGIDMEAEISTKMAYNATRDHRHGGRAL